MKIAKVLLGCALALALPAHAQKACSAADAAAAEKAIDRVVNWAGLHKAYQDYGHCTSGAVNDLFTDALLRLMVEWKNVDAIANAVQKDAGYKKWIHARLQSPAAEADRQDVYSRTKKDCPSNQAAFCAELSEVVKVQGAKAAPTDTLNFDTIKPLGSSAPTEKKK